MRNMIVRKKEHWFKMLFVWRGSVLPALLPRLGLLFTVALLVTYFHGVVLSFKVPLNPVPLTMFGFVLALFLGFRNSASYERFWEGRKLWGALLNIHRALTRQMLTLGNAAGEAEKERFIHLQIASLYALKHQLRRTDATQDMEKYLQGEDLEAVREAKYKFAVLTKRMAGWVAAAKEQGRIDSIQQSLFDANFDRLYDVEGGCERITSTPIPYSYSVLLHRTVYIYCLMLPFGLVDNLGWFTPFIVVFIAYTFVAFEAIADEIEEPFGVESNDLALNSMCKTIEETVLELSGGRVPQGQAEDRYVID